LSPSDAEDRDQESRSCILEAKDHCQWFSFKIGSFHPVLPLAGSDIRFRLLENVPFPQNKVRIQNVKAFICQLFSEMLTRDQSSGRQALTDKVRRFCPG
jgi:hypothetical protein